MFRPLLISMFITSTALATTWTVDDDGKADFDNIQAAVDASSDGDEILVYPGTYTGTGDEVVDMLGKAVWLHSSEGQEVTIIDGEGMRRGILCDSSETSKTIIEGFTIQHGYNDGTDPKLPAGTGGGGMLISGSPSLSTCIFKDNIADSISGGGMYISSGSPTLTNCTFENNTASWGGGIFMTAPNGPFNAQPSLTYCTFKNNFADNGGGIAISRNMDPTITGCTIEGNNVANTGGGLYNHNPGSNPTLTNNVVCSNTPVQIVGNWTDNGGNTILDLCLIGDKDGDGVDDSIDNCYLYNPDQTDCNVNGIGDVCDVADSTSPDCDQNGVPDECQPDCDDDGWIDPCDNEPDIDGDGIPDHCEEDCNGNTMPDHWEIEMGWVEDCNGNLIPDECDISDETVEDCNANGVPDECDIADGTEEDCDANEIPDSCELLIPAESTKLVASDGQDGDSFGWSVSISGNRAIIGTSTYDIAAAYIYSFDGVEWTEESILIASGGSIGDGFGTSVAIDGTRVIVGAPFDNGVSGSAYIYTLDNGVWVQETKLTASDGASQDRFGSSVSISGDKVIVSGDRNDDNGTNSGSAYIYSLVNSIWVETKLLASDGVDNDYFSATVSIDGDRAIIGTAEESAYIFNFDGTDWIEELKLSGLYGALGDGARERISINGNRAIIGGWADNENGSYSGSAYIYHFDGMQWIEEAKLTASDATFDDFFGRSVSINGLQAIVGTSTSKAYLYHLIQGQWIEVAKLIASDGQNNDSFGSSVSISNNMVLVGARGADGNGLNSGAGYVYGPNLEFDCNGNNDFDICEIEQDPSLDCDEDSVIDSCAIASGVVEDCNENGVPDNCELEDPDNDQNNNGELDDCECTGDADGDENVNVNDLLIVISYWGNNTSWADLNLDGIVNVSDLLIVIGNWGPCE